MTKLSTWSTVQQLPHGMTVSSAKTWISTWPFSTPFWAFQRTARRSVLKISRNIIILGIIKARRRIQSFVLAIAMPCALCMYFLSSAHVHWWNCRSIIITGPSDIVLLNFIAPNIPILSAPLAGRGSTAYSLCTLRMSKHFSSRKTYRLSMSGGSFRFIPPREPLIWIGWASILASQLSGRFHRMMQMEGM